MRGGVGHCCSSTNFPIEVESLVSHNVRAALSDVKDVRIIDSIQSSIIQTLERSSAWVDVYECTGELCIPQVEFDGTFPEHEIRVKNELIGRNLTSPSDDDWRLFTIPVDLPCVDVSDSINHGVIR